MLPPNATLTLKPFKLSTPQSALDELKTHLKLAKLAPPTFENAQTDRRFGVSLEWIKQAKERWENGFNWRDHEVLINSFPQFFASVKNSDGREYDIHFIGIFSDKPDAVPVVLLHGWPGSYVEFLDAIPHLKASTSPAFHIIIPSLPGYGFSSQGPLDKDFEISDVAYLVDQLMVGLGFGEESGGYVAQGGDVGSGISTILGSKYPSCKAVHLNTLFIRNPPESTSIESLSPTEQAAIQKGTQFWQTGSAYAMEHATRPSTIGIVLSSSPIALLAWVGEKLLEWTDNDPPLDKILQIVTLWWLMQTFPRSIYPYREFILGSSDTPYISKPFGLSNFHRELIVVPESWAKTAGNLVFYRYHEKGGHFAAMERPKELVEDLIEFLKIAGV